MADRLHPYPMFPQSLTHNSHQQSQIPQQPPPSQQPDPQMISALSNPEHSRMWQQMNQLQQSAYRPQQSGDLAASQVNHQMQDFARGQALSHGPGQPIVQQLQPSFRLNAQRINAPMFSDPQGSQPPSLMPSNFPNMPMNTQQQMKASFNMNPMMHGLNNSGATRQLKMLNQQEIARVQQSGLGAQHPSNQPPAIDMFVPPSMHPSQDQIHGSPHPATQPIVPSGSSQAMVPGNPQQALQKRQAEFNDRRIFLANLVTQAENNLGSLLQTIRATGSIDPLTQQKLNQLRADHNNRKEMYSKFMATFGPMLLANASSNVVQMNPMAHPVSQQPQPTSVSNTQVQPGFVSQANQPITTPYNIPASSSSPLPNQGQGTLNQQIPIQPTQPNTIPPRTTGTPHQIPGGQLPTSVSPGLGNYATQGGQKTPNQTQQSVVIMPLDKQRFDTTYARFCRSQNKNPDPRVAIGEGRMVDLHQLHVAVMREGGAQSVTLRDMWPIIGGRLGFVQFPGTGTEPNRCGPGIAQQLHNTYDQYLQHFENAYILTVKNHPAANPLAVGNNSNPGLPGNPPDVSSSAARTPMNQQIIAMAARYAHVSAQAMRAQRVQEAMISFVERHRPDLQRVYQQQLQMVAKRNAEQEQQNTVNAPSQVSNMHEQPPAGLQRANAVVNMSSGDTKVGTFVQENVAAALHQQQPPTQEQVQQAIARIRDIKHEFQHRLSMMPPLQISGEQRLEYNLLLEQVYKMTSELDSRLHMYFSVLKNEDSIRKHVAIVMTVARQRQLLATSPQQYIINSLTLRAMQPQIIKLNEEFEMRWRAIKASNTNVATNPPPHSQVPPATRLVSPLTAPLTHSTLSITPSTSQTGGRSVSINPPTQPPQSQPSPLQAQLQPPPSHPQTNQSQTQQSQPKKPFPPSPSVPPPPSTLSSPTPPPAAASSSTPATSAPTPQTAAASPQTPKSPSLKAVSKTKSANSRNNRKLSTAVKGPATPEMASLVAGIKRPPEEDVATLTNNSATTSEAEVSNAPSPKKVKTEWEGETSEALVKKQQEIDSVKTDEDAAAFLMKQLFAMTASTDEEIHHDIASTLDQILAGVAQEPADAAATAAALSAHGAGDAGPPPTSLSPPVCPVNDAFLEFIDFSSFTTLEDEDNGSKAPTPDLVPSSDTNASPESGSEGDLLGNAGSPDKTKFDEHGDRSNPLRLGSLKEIDGGESAYYQVDNWNWEGPMHTMEQPWAIFTS